MTYRARTLTALAVCLLSAGLEAAVLRRSQAAHDRSRRANRVLVQFLEPGTREAKARLLGSRSTRPRGYLDRLGVVAVDVSSSETADDVINRLKPEIGKTIAYAEPDIIRYADFTPNDPQLGYFISRIDADAAWDTTSGAGITIAIADSGVRSNHPDLIANLLPGYDVIFDVADGDDINGHGTAVAGAAAAVANNAAGIAGVAFSAKILPIRITMLMPGDPDPVCEAGGCTTDYDVAAAIDYAAAQGAKVINISYSNDFFCWSSAVRNAAARMRSAGGLVVMSAGNRGLNKGCGDDPEIIEVSATGATDVLSWFSNYGASVDVAAPGEDIVTTNCPTCADPAINPGDYDTFSGTSLSAPLVSGVLAMIYTVDAGFTPDRAQQILFDSADDRGPAGKDIYYGWGRVNAASAVLLAQTRTLFFQQNSLTNVYVYPNPWDIRKHAQRQVTFANTPEGSVIKIFTLSGFWVKTLLVPPGYAEMPWDLRNDSGDLVASGLYFYAVESQTGSKVKGKFAVIR